MCQTHAGIEGRETYENTIFQEGGPWMGQEGRHASVRGEPGTDWGLYAMEKEALLLWGGQERIHTREDPSALF